MFATYKIVNVRVVLVDYTTFCLPFVLVVPRNKLQKNNLTQLRVSENLVFEKINYKKYFLPREHLNAF